MLNNISLLIEPGETVAIIGETGCGKTALTNLIAGFYLPSAGDVRIDGISTRQIVPDDLRRRSARSFRGCASSIGSGPLPQKANLLIRNLPLYTSGW